MAKIVIIDDVDEVRATIRRILERKGYEVIEANNGRQGLKAIEKHAPHLVITDILMPDMEGLETIQALIKSNSSIPVIAITASMDTPYLKIALKLGAVAGMYKPFSSQDLLGAIGNALGGVN